MGGSSHLPQNNQTFLPHVIGEEHVLLLEDLTEDGAEKPHQPRGSVRRVYSFMRGVPELIHTRELCLDKGPAVHFVLLYDLILEVLKAAGADMWGKGEFYLHIFVQSPSLFTISCHYLHIKSFTLAVMPWALCRSPTTFSVVVTIPWMHWREAGNPQISISCCATTALSGSGNCVLLL